MVPDRSPGLLRCSIGLMLAHWGLLRGDHPAMASGQGLTDSDNGRFAVALKYKGVSCPTWMAPGLKLLVHVPHQPAVVAILP